MTNFHEAEPESAELTRLAAEILRRRRLRPRFFDRLAFGEHNWELLLHLFAIHKGWASAGEIATFINVSGPTAMEMVKAMVDQGHVVQGDSDGGWEEIPFSLSVDARLKLRAYLRESIEIRLAA